MIRLHVNPHIPFVHWEYFTAPEALRFAVALDGYVRGGPRFDPQGPWANFNHHEDVDRLATRATCAQVLISIRQGLFSTVFETPEDGPRVEAFVNDCDEDVCTAWMLINNQHLVTHTMNPLINRLVSVEDHLDCTAGAYPFPLHLPMLRELAWVFEPYRLFRLGGGLDKKDPAAYRSIITDVEHRILQHVAGRGKEVPIDGRFVRIGGGKDWVMVREIGAQARSGMFAEGIRSFISVREVPAPTSERQRYVYVIGKMAPFIRRDLIKVARKLNLAEWEAREAYGEPLDIIQREQRTWGGGNTIIGSPRVHGSVLTPDQVAKIYENAEDW